MITVIRPAEPEDSSNISKVVKMSNQHLQQHENHKLFLLDQYAPSVITERIAAEVVYVIADENNEAVGSVFLNPATNYLSGLYLHPDYRKQGLGIKLLTELFKEYNPEYSYGATEHDNLPAQKLLKHFGYNITSTPWPGDVHFPGVQWVYLEKGTPQKGNLS